MGRWLEKDRKLPEGVPTKLAELGFVSTPSGHYQEKIPPEMAAYEITVASLSSAWLH